DANGVRIGSVNAVFGRHRYSVRNSEAVSLAEERLVRWPAYLVVPVGLVCLFFRIFWRWPTSILIRAAGNLSGVLHLARKKPTYAARIITPKGPVLVVAAKDKAYVQRVIDALDRAIRDTQHPALDTPITPPPA